MKAWQVIGAKKPLTLNEVNPPTAGPGQVVINVKAAGICHTDVSYLDGTLTHYVGELPRTLGHEIAGTIDSLGEGVTGLSVGQRVVAAADVDGPGTKMHGGFASQVLVPAELLVPLPDEVSFEQGATATDAGMTSMHALNLGEVRKGTKVGIIGAGGLGSLAIQFALGMGAEVYVAEINENIHDNIRKYGNVEVATSITEFADKDLEVIVDYAGFGTTTAEAIETVGMGGTVIQVGLAREQANISAQSVVLKKLRYLGSLGGTPEDVANVISLMAEGKVKSDVNTLSFDQIGDTVEKLARGETTGRSVALID
ncbi:zinc-binding dehydrogenase [Sporosarcina sp. ACRSL]|uniref:zinc-binding dehydrogenase n=1 Tax=Sporosarcina sp. ACRSL TaxID=2918215 RepID=UPI001EF6204A|nr:zinc-binding dehydrogenase [Sporosarcina sp. ACRSL]MCG7346084.1 zinc-binding dehydrogenase [Sporosarcina sp. ACRSL]